jgi:sporulation integral membrane protein YlbJ
MKRLTYTFSILLGLISLIIIINFVLYPEQIFQASLRGLKIWWDVVFPALLPFCIVSELMMGFGLAHFFGILLEPIMRPFFKVPGAGAFALTMSFAAGYPIGAKLTARMREQKLITRSEGERLVSFTCTSDPLFIIGAVAVGFFHDATLGIVLASVHYLTSLLVGMIMRFHDRKGEETQQKASGRFIIFRALDAMHEARINDRRAFGKLMGDAVWSSLQTLFLVGGLLIIFSVFMKIFTLMQFSAILSKIFGFILLVFGIPLDLSNALISGLFEVTLGTQGAAQDSGNSPMIDKVAIAGAILAWGGLSVHAQVASILSTTDIRYKPYLFARSIHAIIACITTYFVYGKILRSVPTSSIPAFLQQVPDPYSPDVWESILFLGLRSSLLLAILVLCSLLFLLLRRIWQVLVRLLCNT